MSSVVVLGAIMSILDIATPLLPKQKLAPVEDPGAEGAARTPVLVH